MKAKIVVDLNFGDSGKGVTVDSLCMDAEDPIVVRFSGGQQCGHNVCITDEHTHTHKSFGSGTLRGIPSYFTHHCTMYLNIMVNEWFVLKDKMKGNPELYLHPLMKVTTPYDVAFNRLTHSFTGHGTTGHGIGATMERHNDTGHRIYVVDFVHLESLKQKLHHTKEYYLDKIHKLGYTEDEFIEALGEEETLYFENLPLAKEIFTIAPYPFLKKFGTVICEGSQGILLDQTHGIYPHVTYADTTSKHALEIAFMLRADIEMYYVTRSYLTRHGNGWIPDGDTVKLVNNELETNVLDPFQGEFRTREFNYDLINYALEIDAICALDSITKNLVITCCDQTPDFVLDKTKLNREFNKIYTRSSRVSSSLI